MKLEIKNDVVYLVEKIITLPDFPDQYRYIPILNFKEAFIKCYEEWIGRKDEVDDG